MAGSKFTPDTPTAEDTDAFLALLDPRRRKPARDPEANVRVPALPPFPPEPAPARAVASQLPPEPSPTAPAQDPRQLDEWASVWAKLRELGLIDA